MLHAMSPPADPGSMPRTMKEQSPPLHGLSWLQPDWPAPRRVRSALTTRIGGASQPPYDTLNLALHVGDDANNVLKNRNLLRTAMGARPVYLEQVHGYEVSRLDPSCPDGMVADACWTQSAGLACTVLVADCLPVLLCDESGSRVAAAHAGWRGLLGQGGRGVLEAVCERLLQPEGGGPSMHAGKLMAWLGPCIGPTAFEVGEDVHTAFVQQDEAAAACFRSLGGGKWMADLPGLARQRLAAIGMDAVYGNDGSLPWCTHSNPSDFFSYRRERVCGRQAALIWLD